MHQRLHVGNDFSTWIKGRIREYNLEEGQDYLIPENSGAKKKGLGGHNRIDYLLTIDTAKELAMVERNEIGRMIRRYFIQKEKEARGEVLTLPGRKEAEIFKGLKPFKINDRVTYPFRKFLMGIGNRPGGAQYYYTKNYPGHVVDFNDTKYISRELAIQIYESRSLRLIRTANQKMNPVLPTSFADPKPLQKGGRHA